MNLPNRNPARLEARHVGKRYGDFVALEDVSAEFRSGEISAVLGENGAGKSTLMGILTGFVAPSRGEVYLDGAPIPLGRAYECKRLGIEMIHQHFTLVPEFTVAENLALARLPGRWAPADARELAAPALQRARELNWEIDPDARVRTLPVGVQQRIEILKALAGEAGVLVFDEPTAVLTPDEVEELFRVLRTLRETGKIVLLIAHKLPEVLAIADRVTVLRQGKWVASAPIGEVNEETLAQWMVGEPPAPSVPRAAAETTEGLRVRDLTVRGDRGEEAVRGVSFEARRGEVFGIGGVDGNGQLELVEALAGIRPAQGGEKIWPGGAPRVSYIPQDRQTDGLALGMSAADNLLVGGYRRPEFSRGALLRRGAIRAWVADLIRRFDVRTASPDEPVSSLSGGNQQKIVVARALDRPPELLIASSPTRGLDLRATEYVRARVREARDAGAAVVLVTTDLEELAALADRTRYMSRGRLVEGVGATAVVGGE